MLPENLSRLRREKGLSQEQLAEQIGVSRQTVSKWENGTSTPELEKIVMLSNFFGLSVDEMVRDSPATPAAPEKIPDSPFRGLGIGLCSLGAVCLIILGILMAAFPTASGRMGESSAITIDGMGILMFLCTAVMAAGIYLVIRKNR